MGGTAMEDHPRALMRAMEANPASARWDFADINCLTDLAWNARLRK